MRAYLGQKDVIQETINETYFDYNLVVTEDMLVRFLGAIVKASIYGVPVEELWSKKDVDFKVREYLPLDHFRKLLRCMRLPGEESNSSESEEVSSLVPTQPTQ